jgi:hypothetical protein
MESKESILISDFDLSDLSVQSDRIKITCGSPGKVF